MCRLHLLIGALIALLLLACERRLLEEEMHNSAKIPIVAHWERAGVLAQNATLLVYRSDSTLLFEKAFASNSSQTVSSTSINLEVGSYFIVVFNEKRDQIDYVRIRGYKHLGTLEAYLMASATAYSTQSRAAGERLVYQPGSLAVSLIPLEVTQEMVMRSRTRSSGELSTGAYQAVDEAIDKMSNLYPVLKTTPVVITTHVAGLNNARMPALIELRNMAEGYLFATDQNSYVPVTTQFTVGERIYNAGSDRDGTIVQQVVTLGLPGDRSSIFDLKRPIYNDIAVQLVDQERTLIEKSFDITELIEVYMDENENLAVHLSATLNLGQLPDVKAEAGSGSGFDSDVADWESEQIDIEL